MGRGIARLCRARILVTSACVVALLALVLLSLNREYQDGLARVSAESVRPVLLDVALVNEDRGVGAGDDQVNLGRGYVAQVESDTSAAWHVLSRGVAERGLTAGSFHLLVVIPADFSRKLLDLESPDPTPVDVTYQVNGQGNARVEALAAQRGREIVAQLNGQLVDMYLASILGDLRQAQEGVRVVVDAEVRNARLFASEVDPAARGVLGRLGILTSGTDGSVEANGTLVDGLDRLGLDQQAAVEDLVEHDGSLAALVEARAAGVLTYGAFLEALMGMDARLLSDEVRVLHDRLTGTGASLVDQLDAGSAEPNHASALSALQLLVDESRRSALDRVDALDGLDEATVLAGYAGGIRDALTLDPEGAVTLADLADAARGLGDPASVRPPELLDLLVRAATEQVAALPYREPAELGALIDRGVFRHVGTETEELARRAHDELTEIREWDRYASVPDAPAAPGEVVGSDLDELAVELLAARARVPRADVPTDSGDGPTLPVHPGGPEEPADPEEAIGDLVAAAGRYADRVRQIADAYRRSAELVRLVGSCEESCGLHPGTDVSGAVGALIWHSVTRQVAAEEQHLAAVTALGARTEAAALEVDVTAAELRRTTERLGADITGQLDEVAAMRAAMRGVLDQESSTARSLADGDARTHAVLDEARALASSGERLVSSALAGADTARRVTDLLTGLRADVESLLDESGELHDGSVRLAVALTGQVEEAGRFADAFEGVLPHAHRSGVLNERLLRFLVDPVSPGGREAVASSDVTRPFPWVLITFALSLSAASVLAGRGGRRRRGASVFARRDDGWFRANVLGLGTASLTGVVLGAGLAWAGAAGLEVPREAQPLWAATVVLAALGQTLLARWLIVQLRSFGLAVCVALLVGYVFVSDAVGTGVTSGFSGVVALLDPLHHVEAAMTRVLGSGDAGPDVLAPLLLVLLGAIVVTLLAQDDLGRVVPRRWVARRSFAPGQQEMPA